MQIPGTIVEHRWNECVSFWILGWTYYNESALIPFNSVLGTRIGDGNHVCCIDSETFLMGSLSLLPCLDKQHPRLFFITVRIEYPTTFKQVSHAWTWPCVLKLFFYLVQQIMGFTKALS